MTERRRDKQVPGVIRFITRMLQIILYIPIQIVFIPFTIVGLIIGAYKEMVRSRRMGVSYSAGQTLQYRWFMHYFDTRPDPYSAAFTRKFPCESHFGLWSLMGALILSQRLFGFTTKLGKIPQPGEETLGSTAAIRVLTFDRILEHYVDEMETNVPPASNPPSRTSACEMVGVYEKSLLHEILSRMGGAVTWREPTGCSRMTGRKLSRTTADVAVPRWYSSRVIEVNATCCRHPWMN